MGRLYRSHKDRGEGSYNSHQPFFARSIDTIQTKKENPFFQTKLSIGKAGDKYEQEADAVANAVVNQKQTMPLLQQKKITSIQRLPSGQEEEKLSTNDARMRKDKEIQEKPEKEREEEVVQQKSNGSFTTSALHSGRIENSSGKGHSMPAKTLVEMNSSFGTDFSTVNIHTDTEAIQMSKELDAQAFTHGHDIYFNAGKFDPHTSDGKSLLAHELTHVIQQGGEKKNIQRQAKESDFPFPGRVDDIPGGEFLLWNFAIGIHSLKHEHQKEIPRIVKSINAILKENPNAEVDVEGLASTSGSVQKNEELSKRRADEVQKALVKEGVDAGRIKVTGSGLSKAFPEATSENMAKSRGVRVVPVLKTALTGATGQLPSLTTQDCSAKMLTNMSLTGGKVNIADDPARPGVRFIEAGDGRSNPGMEMRAVAVVSPQDCGTIEFVQNVRSFREIVYKDQSRNRFETNSMVLDCADPYGHQKIDNTTDPKLIAGSAVDSPAQSWLKLANIEETMQSVEVRDEFKMYLLFKPKKGNRQTMQVGQWTWVGQARNENPRNLDEGFLKLDPAISRVIPLEGKGVTTTESPVFSPVAQHIKWKTISGQPGESIADAAIKLLNKENKQCPK